SRRIRRPGRRGVELGTRASPPGLPWHDCVSARPPAPVSITRRMLLRAFGRPQGVLGRLGGMIMARTNRDCAAWVTGLLEIKPNDAGLQIGFGPGAGIALLVERTPAGHIAGVDPSPEMLRQATARNAAAISGGRVELRRASADALPFADATFDKAFAINS